MHLVFIVCVEGVAHMHVHGFLDSPFPEDNGGKKQDDGLLVR